MRRDAATEAQINASTPTRHVWLSANAGSGKTRVLTDRVARLLVTGVAPQNILCLTFTTAAAAEMQNRLFQRLGDWAMAPDQKLASELKKLDAFRDEDGFLPKARRLFAQAIDTPGGLKIQTIHAFCASLLRAFPLEAGVSPQFQELDETGSRALQKEALNLLCRGDTAHLYDDVARYLSDQDREKLLSEILKNTDDFLPPRMTADILKPFGITEQTSDADILQTAFDGTEPALVKRLKSLREGTSAAYQKFIDKVSAVTFDNPDMAALHALYDPLLKSADDSSKSGNFPQSNHTKAVDHFAPVASDLHALMDRVAAAKELEKRVYSGKKLLSLHHFAAEYLSRIAELKSQRSLLDFDDLILKTRALLSQSTAAEWVRYKLDGQIDHILIDEAQDTSPVQWDIIDLLAQEMSTGDGQAANNNRSLFVVGDRKQSIYSFQGADATGFDRMERLFGQRLDQAQQRLHSLDLSYSFRSSNAVLSLIDQTFQTRGEAGLGGPSYHMAFKSNMPGRVDLWPIVPKTETDEPPEWHDPSFVPQGERSPAILADQIAKWIKTTIAEGAIPEEIDNSGEYRMRPVRPGDFLILVRGRSESGIFREVIAACKSEGLDIAGADRLKLTSELAVKDLMALLSFLALPENDLALATVLRSPLFNWSPQALHTLAQGRKETHIWETLRKREAEHPETLNTLYSMRNAADFLRPFDLLERILIRHDGRKKLLSRLGAEAEDGIDSLLFQAAMFEQQSVPDLSGFIDWMEGGNVEIKRRFDSSSDQIRVMTIHGAKGLEAPIVILPDTMADDKRLRETLLKYEDGVIWKSSQPDQPNFEKEVADKIRSDSQAERDRLLYVAMTRAEKWLVIAGAEPGKAAKDTWYETIQKGMETSGATEHAFDGGTGLRLQHGEWGAAESNGTAQSTHSIELPTWIDAQVTAEKTPPQTLSPSNLGGAKGLAHETDQSPEAQMHRGRQIHRLLEHLPAFPQSDWADMSLRLIPDLPEEELKALLAHVTALLNNPDLAFLFAEKSLAEVDISATLPELSNQKIYGAIDRLIIGEDRILIVDFKSNAAVPTHPEEVPEGFLRQLGAYAAAIRQIYPEHQVETAILWTETATLMRLPDGLVTDALLRTELP